MYTLPFVPKNLPASLESSLQVCYSYHFFDSVKKARSQSAVFPQNFKICFYLLSTLFLKNEF